MLKQLTVVAVAFLIGIVAAAALVTYLHPMTATITDISLTRTLDSTLLADDDPIDWGIVEPDSTYQFDDLTVENTGNVDANVTILSPLLPAGWTLTWTMNNTVIAPAASLSAPLILYVASDAVLGQVYSWNCNVTATEA